MEDRIEKLVRAYEKGGLTRRQLVVGLTALVSGTAAASSPSTFKATGLNHVALAVTDIARSRDFYTKLLGMRVNRESAGSCFLTFGDNFVALFRRNQAGMDHYCYSVEGYDVHKAAQKLREQNLESRVTGDRIYFDDPDGLTVQLAAAEHRP